jgi:hypothetical protein
MGNETVSVSASNLIVALRGTDSDSYVAIAVRHPTKIDLYQSLSAGPAIHHIEKESFAALGVNTDTWKPKSAGAYSVEHYDGRVEGLPVSKYKHYVQSLMHSATEGSGIVDWRVMPELQERLTQPYWDGIQAPLTKAEVRLIQVEAGGLVRQPSDASGQGGLGHKVRIFRPCKLFMPDAVLQKLLDCQAFVSVSFTEMSTTRGGKQEGYFERNEKQFRLANNVGVDQHPLGLFTLQ